MSLFSFEKFCGIGTIIMNQFIMIIIMIIIMIVIMIIIMITTNLMDMRAWLIICCCIFPTLFSPLVVSFKAN